MTKITLDRPGTLPEHILTVLERDWGFGLPKDYRKFLLEHNGGEPTPNVFKLGATDSSGLRSFFCIYPDKYDDLLWNLNVYHGRVPKNIFPIGSDSFGNLICISVMGSDRGKIYFWDHEMEAGDDEEADYTNLTLIADSFEEFLNSLHEQDV
jgi:hypothetical protein